MTELIDKIQDWYKLNCDGDWEHSYGYSIATLDNPGWTVRIYLTRTALANLEFSQQYQNPLREHDWYFIKTKERVLDIACGPDNLKQVLLIFFDTILPKFADKDFHYVLHLPFKGHHLEIWTPVTARIINERALEIVEIDQIEYKNVKVRNFEQIDFDQSDLDKMSLDFKKGDIVEVELEEVADGLIRTPKKK